MAIGTRSCGCHAPDGTLAMDGHRILLEGLGETDVLVREKTGLAMAFGAGFAGAGLCGRNRPEFMSKGLSGLGAPLADVLILQASHEDSPAVTPLRFRKARSPVVQSAPMRG